jgi:DNA invertase Pin-like site-specific DNA recombinase
VKAIIYNRHSQDSGTGVSEDIQDPAMLALVESRGGTVVLALPSDDASSWTLDRPEFVKARAKLNAGEADTLVIPKLNRLTRRRWHWEELVDEMDRNGWTVVPLDFPALDLSTSMGRMMAGIQVDMAEAEYRDKLAGMNASRRNAVEKHGVHGGDTAPLGYTFTSRGTTKLGKNQRGPLVPTKDAARVLAGFTCYADGGSWREVVAAFGIKSHGNARAILENRVYLGEARSGEFVKPGAHPALVSEALFARCARRLQRGAQAGAPTRGNERALLSGVLFCGCGCGHALTLDRSVGSYRCKAVGSTGHASVQAELVEPVVLAEAQARHAAHHPVFMLGRDTDSAILPALEDALAEAEAAVEEIRTANGLSALRRAQALTEADAAVATARAAVLDAEATQSWLGLDPARVAVKLADADVATRRSFIREIVRVSVAPVGRGARVPVASRLTYLQTDYVGPLPEGVADVFAAMVA